MTVKERLMNELSAQIREKSDWERKFRDPEISKKWRAEARHVDDEMFRYVIEELDYYQSLEDGAIKVLLVSLFIFLIFLILLFLS
jgi:hypothetical protein